MNDPSHHPTVWVLAGGNGVGKSTFHRRFLQPRGVHFINADMIQQEIDSDSYTAAQEARARFRQQLQLGMSFSYETVFSHESKLHLIEQAKEMGYQVNLVCIHVNPGLNELRVLQRVSEGGHDVDPDKIRTRIPRTLTHLKEAIILADNSVIYDNSSASDPFRHIATRQLDKVTFHVEAPPQWAIDLLT